MFDQGLEFKELLLTMGPLTQRRVEVVWIERGLFISPSYTTRFPRSPGLFPRMCVGQPEVIF